MNYLNHRIIQIILNAHQLASEVNVFIKESLEKVMSKVGVDEEAPETLSKMMKSSYQEEFREAMDTEIKSIMEHGTFEETYCSEGVAPITCRWVYDYKTW
jgi:hypothetical protein